jgi:hypothetical protein
MKMWRRVYLVWTYTGPHPRRRHSSTVKLSLCLNKHQAMTIYGTGSRAPSISTSFRDRIVWALASYSGSSGYLDRSFSLFSCPPSNADAAPQIRLRQLLPTLLPNHYSLIILSFDTIYAVLLTAVLMRHESTNSCTTIWNFTGCGNLISLVKNNVNWLNIQQYEKYRTATAHLHVGD